MSVTRYTRSIGRLERVVCAENLREIRRISKHILAQAILTLKDLECISELETAGCFKPSRRSTALMAGRGTSSRGWFSQTRRTRTGHATLFGNSRRSFPRSAARSVRRSFQFRNSLKI